MRGVFLSLYARNEGGKTRKRPSMIGVKSVNQLKNKESYWKSGKSLSFFIISQKNLETQRLIGPGIVRIIVLFIVFVKWTAWREIASLRRVSGISINMRILKPFGDTHKTAQALKKPTNLSLDKALLVEAKMNCGKRECSKSGLPSLAIEPAGPVAGGGAGGWGDVARLKGVTALVGNAHLGDGLAVGFRDQLQAVALGARLPAFAPLDQRDQYGIEIAALGGQAVGDAPCIFGVFLAGQDAPVAKPLEPVGQGVGRDFQVLL